MVRALITHCLSLFLGLRRLEGPLHRTTMSVLNTVTYISKVKVIWKLAAVLTSWYPHTCLMYKRSAVSPRCLWFNNYTVWWVVVVALRLLAQGLPSALWIKAYLKLSKRCVSSVRLSCATKVVGRQSDDHTPSMAPAWPQHGPSMAPAWAKGWHFHFSAWSTEGTQSPDKSKIELSNSHTYN